MRGYLILGLILLVVSCAGQQKKYVGCEGQQNDQPLVNGTFQLVAQVPNGQKFTQPYDGRLFYLLNLTGNAYEMGLAYGKLMKTEIPEMLNDFNTFLHWLFYNNISSVITKLPKFAKNWMATTAITIGLGMLDLNYYICLPYTNKRWVQEMQGIADGSGIDIWHVRQVNMIAELLKASCSILGGYGKSTATKKTIHLRSLDWEAHAPMSRWPLITVYHSTEAGSIPFSNIAWPLFIGSLTGYSSAKIGVGERLGGAPAAQMTRFGTPWTFVLRDALQFSKTQADYVQYLNDAHRTCAIYLGVGGSDYFNILEYSYGYLRVYNWTNWKNDTAHPVLEDILWKAFHDDSECFKSIVDDNYGNITPETIYRYIAPMGQTGDSQVAVMDYSSDIVYCMYPNPVTFNPGYNAPPISVDLKPFFNNIAH